MGVAAEDRAGSPGPGPAAEEDFEAFYRRRFGPMVRFAAVVVGDVHDAAEIVQSAFAAMYPATTASATAIPTRTSRPRR